MVIVQKVERKLQRGLKGLLFRTRTLNSSTG
jgi:hypothetical protein